MNSDAAAIPAMSKEPVRRVIRGSSITAPMATATGSGSWARNTRRQPPRSVRSPPTTGPMTAPSAPDVKYTPIADARRSGGKAVTVMASETVYRIPPKIPWTTRAATSSS